MNKAILRYSQPVWSGLAFTVLAAIVLSAIILLKPWIFAMMRPGLSAAETVVFFVGVGMCVYRVHTTVQKKLDKRLIWASLCLLAAMFCQWLGQAIWTVMLFSKIAIPFPSWSDPAYLSTYPFLLAAILCLPNRRFSQTTYMRVILDALLVLTTIVAWSWLSILGPTIGQIETPLVTRITATAYPLCDLLLVFCLLLLAFRSRVVELHPMVYLLFIALTIIVVTDSIYDIQMLQGTYAYGGILDLGWPLGYILVAVAALALPDRPIEGIQAPSSSQASNTSSIETISPVWSTFLPYGLLPFLACCIFLAWETQRISSIALGVYLIAAVFLLVLPLRQLLTLREMDETNRKIQQLNHELQNANSQLREATTDALTDLPTHRALITRLDEVLAAMAQTQEPCSILMINIDHFKALNDAYGHSIGDQALRAFADMMRPMLRTNDIFGRWGGETFLVILTHATAQSAALIAERLRQSVAETLFPVGGGVRLTCSIGIASFPDDTLDRDSLLRQAQQALQAAKALGRNQICTFSDPRMKTVSTPLQDSEDTLVSGVVDGLVALVEARDGYTGEHTSRVGALTLQLALSLGLGTSEAYMIGLAGKLHDLGKIGIRDAVLLKPGKLNDEEWVLMRQHPAIGYSILNHIPCVRPLSAIVRAHHERWDGKGYPDGLAGDAIPWGARIISVVDAYEAMTTDRPYQKARSSAEAIAELRRCAGSQFDPRVVEALVTILEAEPEENNSSALVQIPS